MEKKLPNLQKESDKLKIKKIISDNEDRKVKVLLEMGMKTYSKIRKGELSESDFEEMSEEIKNIDIEIYTQYLKLRHLEEDTRRITCECGYIAYKNEKFCPQCGNSFIQQEESYIICDICNSKNELDSNYCGCCGHKIYAEKELSELNNIESEIIYDMVDDCEDDIISDEIFEEKNINQYRDEEENKVEVIELEGREFLKHQSSDNDDKIV